MNVAAVAAVILLAVLVGTLLPVLFQLRATLRSAQSLLDATGPRLQRALDEVTTAAQRLNQVAAELEAGAGKAQSAIESVADLGRQVGRVRDTVRTAFAWGGALAPALVAAARAFLSRPDTAPEAAPAADSQGTTQQDER